MTATNLGSLYTEIYFYCKSDGDFDQRWDSWKRKNKERACPNYTCDPGEEMRDSMCYKIPEGWEYSHPGFCKRNCRSYQDSRGVRAYDTGSECVIDRDTGGGVWRGGVCVYKSNCKSKGGCWCTAAKSSCPSGFDVVGNSCRRASRRSCPGTSRKLTDSACHSDMWDASESGCHENDFDCPEDFYKIDQSDCKDITCDSKVTGNAGCGSNTAIKCARLNVNTLKSLGPTDFITDNFFKRIHHDKKQYRVKLDLSKLIGQPKSVVLDTFNKVNQYFMVNNKPEATLEITYRKDGSDKKKAVLYCQKYNQYSLDLFRYFILYNFTLTDSEISTVFSQNLDNVLNKVLVFFLVNVNDAGSSINQDLTYMDEFKIEWDILPKNADQINPYFYNLNNKLKWVTPNLSDNSHQIDTTDQTNDFPDSSVMLIKLLGTDLWPSDFVTDKPLAVFAGYINLNNFLVMNDVSDQQRSSQMRRLVTFKNNFICNQVTRGLPEGYLNWNRTLYYNILLPKIAFQIEPNPSDNCPLQTNYFNKNLPKEKGPCMYATSTYCLSQTINCEKGSGNACDINYYCLNSQGLLLNQQPANSLRKADKLNASATSTCNNKCVNNSNCILSPTVTNCMGSNCPKDCQCQKYSDTWYFNNANNPGANSTPAPANTVLDFRGASACWFLPCQDPLAFVVSPDQQSYKCSQTTCQNIINVYNVNKDVAEKNIKMSNQCEAMGITLYPSTPGPPTTNPPVTTTPRTTTNPPTTTKSPTSQVPLTLIPGTTQEPSTTPTPKKEKRTVEFYIGIGLLGLFVIFLLWWLLFGEDENSQQQQQQQQQSIINA